MMLQLYQKAPAHQIFPFIKISQLLCLTCITWKSKRRWKLTLQGIMSSSIWRWFGPYFCLAICLRLPHLVLKKIYTIYGWGNDYRSVYCKNDDGGWVGSHSEIVALSEIYSVQIHIFYSIVSQEPITRVVTADGDYTISILFSGDHYECLIF